MPLSKTTFVRATTLAILFGMVALLAIVAANLWLVGEARTSVDAVSAARLQRSALADLRGLLQDAETGQRGYLLTGSADYLEPYEDGVAKIPAQLDRVRTLLAGDPKRAAVIDRLTVVVNDKLTELKGAIGLLKAGSLERALEAVKTNRGRDLMDEARDIFDVQVAEAEKLIGDSLQRQQDNVSTLRLVTILSAIFITLVLGGAAAMVVTYTRQLIEAQQEVQSLNVGLEGRIQERTTDLQRANDEIQRFAYIVTHDLRAPLVNIMGFTSELETSLASIQKHLDEDDKQKPDGGDAMPAARSDAEDAIETKKEAQVAALEDLPEAIGFIRSSTRKMDGLINAILKLSRDGRRTLKPEPIDLGALLETAADSVRHQVVDAGGEVSIEGTIPPVVSDRLALEQIFGNLLDNAVKYRLPNRPLQIRVRAHREPGRRIIVEVQDNGRGIDSKDHERVFDLFRRSGSQDQPGEGIGLAHVRSMIRNLGGDITLKSELERGTTMKLSLPNDLRSVTGAI
jgi:signal transduction histidine kinase